MQQAFSSTHLENLMPTFESIFHQLHCRAEAPPLFPTQPFDPEISRLVLETDDEAFGSHMGTHAAAARIGLLLLNDDLQSAHPLSQDMKNATGSCWHAIIHRREGDFNNSLYWWRLTGVHPAFSAVYEAVVETPEQDEKAQEFLSLLQREKTWQPDAFVACCREAKQTKQDHAWLRRAQLAEMTTLLEWCRNGGA